MQVVVEFVLLHRLCKPKGALNPPIHRAPCALFRNPFYDNDAMSVSTVLLC